MGGFFFFTPGNVNNTLIPFFLLTLYNYYKLLLIQIKCFQLISNAF